MAYTDFGFMRPEEASNQDDGPVKNFFKKLFRPQRGLVGDAPVTGLKKSEPVVRQDPNRRVIPDGLSDAEKIAIEQDEREKMLEYMRHPSYKERLKKEIFYDSFNPNNKRNVKTLEDEYSRRLSEISTIPISRGRFSEVKDSELTYGVPYGAYYSMVVGRGYKLPGGAKGELAKKGFPQIVMSEDLQYPEISKNPNLYRQVLRHELGHSSHSGEIGGHAYSEKMNEIPWPTMVENELYKHSESPAVKEKLILGEFVSPYYESLPKRIKQKTDEVALRKLGPEKFQQIKEAQAKMNAEYNAIKKEKGLEYANEYGPDWNNPEFREIHNDPMFRHLDQSDTEVATRMIGLRRLAADKFGHNMNEDFDIKKYKDQLQNYFKQNGMIDEYKQLSKDLGLSDDQINEMMKYIARVPQQQSTRYTG
jgi:hypothetical protein